MTAKPRMSRSASAAPRSPATVVKRAKKIKLFLMDVDGTLTEGGVCLLAVAGAGAAAEMKVFNAHDGAGLTLAHIMGIKTGFISGLNSLAVVQRANEVHADFVYQGQAKKIPAYRECVAKAGVKEDEVCYLGDDLPDIPLLERVGLAVAVRYRIDPKRLAAVPFAPLCIVCQEAADLEGKVQWSELEPLLVVAA